MDISVTNTLLEDNLIVNNSAVGIWYEISYNATIRGNTVLQTRAQRFMSGIRVTEAWDVLVEDNFISGIDTALTIQDQNGNRSRGGIADQHVSFVDNTVCSSRSGGSGFALFGTGYTPSLDSTLWSGNAYYGTTHQRGSLVNLSSAEWQALGYDLDGAIGPLSGCPAVPDPR